VGGQAPGRGVVTVFEAKKFDIVAAAGGPMGSPVNLLWDALYSTERKAKAACEKDFGKPLKWKGRSLQSSGDLGAYEYTVGPRAVL
jgi:hypothetical protein